MKERTIWQKAGFMLKTRWRTVERIRSGSGILRVGVWSPAFFSLERNLGILDERLGMYSAIALSDGRRQPFLEPTQDFIDDWFAGFQPQSALVLGCAGCAIPRYLLASFPRCVVRGVEIDKTLVELARRRFLSKLDLKRFQLIVGDAADPDSAFPSGSCNDLVFSDVYVGAEVADKVYTHEFFERVENSIAGSSRGVFVANMSRADPSTLNRIMETANEVLGATALFHSGNMFFLVSTTRHAADALAQNAFEHKRGCYRSVLLRVN